MAQQSSKRDLSGLEEGKWFGLNEGEELDGKSVGPYEGVKDGGVLGV